MIARGGGGKIVNIGSIYSLYGTPEFTDLTRGMPATPLGEQIRRKTPAGRWGEPEDLVGTAIFLCSAASDFVTGVPIPVDGGYTVAERLREDG
jgi:NAD(P)-dependent dehydrogenase (short-subunit alcohol dehydrogenase family)